MNDMMRLSLMLGGCFVTLIGFYARYKRKDIGTWLNGKRIDNKKSATIYCEDCGAVMKRRTYKSGHREGASALVCSNYPDCSSRIWGV